MISTVVVTARRYNLPALAATLTGAVLLPVAVHLLPDVNNVPMGARLLPMFLTPLVAIYLARPAVGIAAAALAPILNNAITGRPAGPMLTSITIELVVFSLIISLAHGRWPRFAGIAPLAYIMARAIAVATMATFGDSSWPTGEGFLRGLALAVPGIVLLTLLNIVLVRAHGGGEGHGRQ
jgi:hypothetical protein